MARSVTASLHVFGLLEQLERSRIPNAVPASVARRDARCLLSHLALPPNHRRQGPQGLVDRGAVREDVKNITSDHNDIRAFGITCRGSAAYAPREVVFGSHSVTLSGIVWVANLLHIPLFPFGSLFWRRLDASTAAARRMPRRSVVGEVTCRAGGNVPLAANDPGRSRGVPAGHRRQSMLRRTRRHASEDSTAPFRCPNRIRKPSLLLNAGRGRTIRLSSSGQHSRLWMDVNRREKPGDASRVECTQLCRTERE